MFSMVYVLFHCVHVDKLMVDLNDYYISPFFLESSIPSNSVLMEMIIHAIRVLDL